MGKVRKRLDTLLVERGFFESRHKAQEAIESGSVQIPGKGILKPSTLVEIDADIYIVDKPKYVSRGGYKLEKALEYWNIDVEGLDCLDAGSSTGGFIDCLLKHGAKRVIGIDVGKDLLHESLKNDLRVYLIEDFNIRYLKAEMLPFIPEFVSCDLSFISIKKVFPAIKGSVSEKAGMVFLIKPQFEAGREHVRKGLVIDREVHKKILLDFYSYFTDASYSADFTHSPVKGGKGNIEYLCYIKPYEKREKIEPDIDKIIKNAFLELKGDKD